MAYVSQPGNQIGNINAHWSSDIITVSPVVAATALEAGQGSGTASNGSLFYRCVFYRTN